MNMTQRIMMFVDVASRIGGQGERAMMAVAWETIQVEEVTSPSEGIGHT